MHEFVVRERMEIEKDIEAYKNEMRAVCDTAMSGDAEEKLDRNYQVSIEYYAARTGRLRKMLGALPPNTQKLLGEVIDAALEKTAKDLSVYRADLSRDDEKLQFLKSYDMECEMYQTGSVPDILRLMEEEPHED